MTSLIYTHPLYSLCSVQYHLILDWVICHKTQLYVPGEQSVQCSTIITWFWFSPKYPQHTPYSSPMRARYGLSFVSSKSDWFSDTRSSHCNSTWLYMFVFSLYEANGCTYLTLNMWGPSYLGLTRSISWLLMPWLLTSPGHQQPWYWLCRICKSWSYLRKDFKYMCHINVE